VPNCCGPRCAGVVHHQGGRKRSSTCPIGSPQRDQAQADTAQHPAYPPTACHRPPTRVTQLSCGVSVGPPRPVGRPLVSPVAGGSADSVMIWVNDPRTELGCAGCLGAVHAAVADQHHIDARACLDCDDERSELLRQGTIRSLKHACWCRDVSSSPPPDTFDCHGGIHRKPLTCTYVSPPCPHRPSESRPYERHGGLCVENL